MSWLLAFVGFASLIILHELGHFAVAKAVGMRVERFSLFFGPMVAKRRRGETEYGIGVIPLGGYVKISGMNPREELAPEVRPRSYFLQAPWKRIAVIAAGPMVNVLLAFVIFAVVYLATGEPRGPANPIVAIDAGHPAAGVLHVGDRIVSVDGHRGPLSSVSSEISSHRCAGTPVANCQARTPVRLVVMRQGRLLHLSIRPRYDPAAKRTLLGFSFRTAFGPTNLVSSARLSLEQMWAITSLTVSKFTELFYSAQARSQVHGTVGLYETTRQAFSFDVTQAFFLLGLISLSLAIINLFPFLPLDGGHIFWAVAEKFRGRRIPFSVMERAGVVGFVLIIFIFLIGFSNDINTLQNGGFHVR